MTSWGWKKVGVVWGLTANFQAIWDDTKNVLHDLNMSMQVSYGAPSVGQPQHQEESLAQVTTAETAVRAAELLL